MFFEKSFFQLFCILKAFFDEFKNKHQLNFKISKNNDLNNISKLKKSIFKNFFFTKIQIISRGFTEKSFKNI